MASFLHLIKGDSSDLAAPVIASNLAEPDARVTVVLLEGALPTEPGWNADGHPVRTVSRAEIAALVPTATRFLVF